MSMNSIQIVIDSREKRKLEFRSYFQGRSVDETRRSSKKGKDPNFHYEVEIRKLDEGDILICANGIEYCIEIKQMGDFFSSVMNTSSTRKGGHLIDQLKRMSKKYDYDKMLLIIEGTYKRAVQWSHMPEGLYNSIRLSIMHKYCPILHAEDFAKTKTAIHNIAANIGKEPSPERVRSNKLSVGNEVGDQQDFILAGFPQLGPKTITDIREKYSNMGEFFESMKDITDKDGKRLNKYKELIWGGWK